MRRWWLLVVLLSVLGPAAAAAQTAWDSPLLLPPRPADGFGIFLIDPHDGGIGVLGTWRSPIWNYGVRAGISEGPNSGDIALFGGIDYTGPVNTATEYFPVDVDWVFGAGLGISDGARVSLPLGLTAAYSFQGEGARFTPYITPRVVLDGWFGGDIERDLELGFAVDLGLDLRFTAGGGPLGGSSIRFGAALGDRNAIGIGLVF